MITNKWIFTVGAGKWLLSCVDFVMFLQPLIFCKGFVSVGTGKWLLSCMGPFRFLKLILCENEMSYGANNWLLFYLSHVMFLQITVCKGLVILNQENASPLCEPNDDSYFCQPFWRPYKYKFAHENDLVLIIICFGTFSTVSIFHCGPILVLTIIYDLLHILILFQISWVELIPNK